MKNTKNHGVLRFFIYFDDAEKTVVGVCIDLGIIREGNNFETVRKEIVEAAIDYVGTVVKKGLSDDLLTQAPPKEYLDLYKKYLASMTMPRRTTRQPQDFIQAEVFSEAVA